MPSYKVTIATSSQWFAGTDNSIYLTLVGKNGSSEKTLMDKLLYNDFECGAVDTYDINVTESLGDIELVKIEKQKYGLNDEWFCKNIIVKTPDDLIQFPCFRWIVDDKEVVLQDGKARLPQDEKSPISKQYRSKELENRQNTFRWIQWVEGFPLSIDAKGYHDLPRDIQFDTKKRLNFGFNYLMGIGNLGLNQFMNKFQTSWDSLEHFTKIFIAIKDRSSGQEYVMNHWQEDFLFGYQYLNGCNPVIIKKCEEIPKKFPVTHEMVANILERDLTLEDEVAAGNVFIADYDIMEGITPNATDPHTTQYLAAPICLFYKNKQNKIYPIAIQLTQTPGEDSPIFLPSDAKYDWLLAKMWVKSSDFQVHQTVSHLFRTHLISEVFSIAMFRQLPAVHPIYKLLLPHTRFTIAINTVAREELIGDKGLFDKANSTGGGGHVQLVQKAMKTLTYKSLCFPDSIKARGMDNQEEIPNYFYRDDGNMVWETIKSFVCDVVSIYYGSDERVQADEEIQAFVNDVCSFGLKNSNSSGFPKSLHTQEQLVEYVTVVIFTASAQHAAVNFGQFDWWSWVPNAPSTMRQPIPTKKGQVDMKYIMESLPDRGRSSWHLGAVWALSQFQKNELVLGTYPDEHFIEKSMEDAFKKFRNNLDKVIEIINKRNEGKELQYVYLSPKKIPNSVAV